VVYHTPQPVERSFKKSDLNNLEYFQKKIASKLNLKSNNRFDDNSCHLSNKNLVKNISNKVKYENYLKNKEIT